jgi:hypothetical protein
MSKCDHLNAKYEIVIERWCDAYLQTSEICDNVNVTHDEPVSIKVGVTCPDCEFVSRYNAYSARYCEKTNRLGRAAADRWPTWLLNRLIPLRDRNSSVQEACQACGVLPLKHASW